MIGLGKQIYGLFYYIGIHQEKDFEVGGVMSLDLWHRQMGYPSLKITKLVSNMSSNNNDYENKACDVCQRAKQTRDSFPLSDHKATGVFNLIHYDLWGLYKTPSSCGAYYFLTIMDDHSRVVWIYLLLDKKEDPRSLMNFITLI